jgi:predicted AAA+ superfamily ATPase
LAKQDGRVYIWRERQKEVDFIWEKGMEKIPIEVKFQNQIHPSDLKNMLGLCKRRGLPKGIVVT